MVRTPNQFALFQPIYAQSPDVFKYFADSACMITPSQPDNRRQSASLFWFWITLQQLFNKNQQFVLINLFFRYLLESPCHLKIPTLNLVDSIYDDEVTVFCHYFHPLNIIKSHTCDHRDGPRCSTLSPDVMNGGGNHCFDDRFLCLSIGRHHFKHMFA